MNKDEPRKLWLQVYDEEGNYMDPEWRTFSADERVNPTDLCYVRWGKTNILCIERDAALARAEEAEARVAELEAQLAAQQWRPIDEPAPGGPPMTYAAADHHTIRPRVMTDADHQLADLLRRHPDGLTIREIARLFGVTYEEAALVLRAAAHLIDQRAQLEAQP